jgi:Rieske Fe-S protein
MEMPARGEWITVEYTDYKELEKVGGAIQINVENKNEPIILMRSSERRFQALSPICTHLGCEVKVVKTGFRCPCHGSSYDEEGQVVNGPAREDLASYQIAQKGRQISIRVM